MKLLAPINGTLKTMKSLKDGVFSEEMMGPGFVIAPDLKEGNTVYAPISGKLVTVFSTGHAYGIEAKDGTKVLVHIGLDTVGLGGEGFEVLVKQGKKIKAGAPMVNVDFESVKTKVPSINVITMVMPDSDTKLGKLEATGKVTTSTVVAEAA